LEDLPLPWPYNPPHPSIVSFEPKLKFDYDTLIECSVLNGVSLASVLLALAYQDCSRALSLLGDACEAEGDALDAMLDKATKHVITAILFFERGKHIHESTDDVIFQQSRELTVPCQQAMKCP
jgi:hypothetical protein